MKTKQSLIPFGINAPLICIEWVLISQLKLNARNARVHPDAQIVMLARSIDTFGITKPIIIDELNRVLCGNAIVQAAERLGMTSVPAVRLTHLTKEQKRALAIADNKLAEKSVWDFDVLKTELLSIIDVEPDFDLFAIGFETPELDIILDVADEHDDALPELAPDRFVAQPGDLFRLGNHCVHWPLALIADIIKDASKRGDFILDPFGGSGTTLIAAEKTGRRAALLELDPRYVDVIVRRWEAYTGCDAICTRTGMTFAEREQAKNPK